MNHLLPGSLTAEGTDSANLLQVLFHPKKIIEKKSSSITASTKHAILWKLALYILRYKCSYERVGSKSKNTKVQKNLTQPMHGLGLGFRHLKT